MLFPIFDPAGRPAHAHFTMESSPLGWNVWLESRGGTKGTPSERNSGYAVGLRLLLERLAALGMTLQDALVDSRETARQGLDAEKRRLGGTGLSYPLEVTLHTDTEALARALMAAQGDVGSTRSKGRGNSTKRILLEVERGHLPANFDLASRLSAGTALGQVTGEVLASSTPEQDFDAGDAQDARRRILRSIAQRQGQPQFRRRLLAAYGGRCAVTGCDFEDALEAAHIQPYKGPQTHHGQNGILLRADLHTLFDRGLISVDPANWRVVVSPRLQGTHYGQLQGAVFAVPKKVRERPSAEALTAHMKASALDQAVAVSV